MATTIYQGDDLRAFGGTPIELEITNETGFPVKRMIFTCGNIIREWKDLPEFSEPLFIIMIYLTSEETRILRKINKGYVACFDEDDNKLTTEGYFEFEANEEVVYDKVRS